MAWTTPKTDWTTGELVSASDMNSIGENLAALNRQRQQAIAVGLVSGNAYTTAGAFVDIDSTGMNLTITTAGGDVLVHFHGSIRKRRSGGSVTIKFDIEVDGSRQGGIDGITLSKVDSNYKNVSFTRLIQGLSAGSHTFKPQWHTGDGHLLPYAQFWVREI